MSSSFTYKNAGVDITAGERLVAAIKPFARKTRRPGVMGGLGGFGSLFALDTERYRNPVLVAGTDGVGTKLKLACAWNRHESIGIDLVAMSVNDILVQGAEPLFFLDYFSCGKLDVSRAATVIAGIAAGCELAGCALVGGETAEMPGMYPDHEYDLAGFAVGVAEKEQLITGASIKPGDLVLGLASSGAHANGYSLIRQILAAINPDLDQNFADGKTLRDVLLAPTRIYVSSLRQILPLGQIKGLAHITGGGLLDNIPRILPADTRVVLDKSSWTLPKLFSWLREKGNISAEEMYRTFNCGVGMVLFSAPQHARELVDLLTEFGETVFVMGKVVSSAPGEKLVTIS